MEEVICQTTFSPLPVELTTFQAAGEEAANTGGTKVKVKDRNVKVHRLTEKDEELFKRSYQL